MSRTLEGISEPTFMKMLRIEFYILWSKFTKIKIQEHFDQILYCFCRFVKALLGPLVEIGGIVSE